MLTEHISVWRAEFVVRYASSEFIAEFTQLEPRTDGERKTVPGEQRARLAHFKVIEVRQRFTRHRHAP